MILEKNILQVNMGVRKTSGTSPLSQKKKKFHVRIVGWKNSGKMLPGLIP